MKIVIRSNHPDSNEYIVSLSDGTKYLVKTIQEAIKLKEDLSK